MQGLADAIFLASSEYKLYAMLSDSGQVHLYLDGCDEHLTLVHIVDLED